jgi:hypothetical protein
LTTGWLTNHNLECEKKNISLYLINLLMLLSKMLKFAISFYWPLWKLRMLILFTRNIKSNLTIFNCYWINLRHKKGNNCIPPLRNCINDQNIYDITYDDLDKCELLNNYISSSSKLYEENVTRHVTLPQFDSTTSNIIHELYITENEIKS